MGVRCVQNDLEKRGYKTTGVPNDLHPTIGNTQ